MWLLPLMIVVPSSLSTEHPMVLQVGSWGVCAGRQDSPGGDVRVFERFYKGGYVGCFFYHWDVTPNYGVTYTPSFPWPHR